MFLLRPLTGWDVAALCILLACNLAAMVIRGRLQARFGCPVAKGFKAEMKIGAPR